MHLSTRLDRKAYFEDSRRSIALFARVGRMLLATGQAGGKAVEVNLENLEVIVDVPRKPALMVDDQRHARR